jgi:hypothetical protein
MRSKRDELIYKAIEIKPTAKDKGMKLNMEVTIYDTGIIQFGNIVLNGEHKEAEQVDAVHALWACDHASRAIRMLIEDCEMRWTKLPDEKTARGDC